MAPPKGNVVEICCIQTRPVLYHPDTVRYKVIGVEMKGMESSMKPVALGATQRKG